MTDAVMKVQCRAKVINDGLYSGNKNYHCMLGCCYFPVLVVFNCISSTFSFSCKTNSRIIVPILPAAKPE